MNQGNELLREVLSETLEGFAFLLAEPTGTVPYPSTLYLRGTITFHSIDHTEQLTIVAPEALCREMAANILGVEIEEIPVGAMEDALQELSNVVAGSYAARRFGTAEACDIDAPVSSRLTAAQASEFGRRPDVVALVVDDQPVIADIENNEDSER